jgi:serine/threonine-protein kinase
MHPAPSREFYLATVAAQIASHIINCVSKQTSSLVGNKYRLKYRIGQGAMGVVWSAVNELTSRQVAVKLILSARDDLQERLIREARACGQLSHRNIIEVLDAGVTEQGEPFLVMPLLVGETLADLLERRRRLEHSTVAQIGREIARGLVAAHAAGIVHRDLKPSNIFLHQEPGAEGAVVKIVDFGICKRLNNTDENKLTTTGKVVGSPCYMSPEQFNHKMPIDPRTDIWSLGVMLFEVLTGVRPFQGDRVKIILSIINEREEIPPVSQLVRGVPPGLVEIVSGCLERDRERRISSAAKLAELLGPFASAGDYIRIYADSPKHEIVRSARDQALEQPKIAAQTGMSSEAAGLDEPAPGSARPYDSNHGALGDIDKTALMSPRPITARDREAAQPFSTGARVAPLGADSGAITDVWAKAARRAPAGTEVLGPLKTPALHLEEKVRNGSAAEPHPSLTKPFHDDHDHAPAPRAHSTAAPPLLQQLFNPRPALRPGAWQRDGQLDLVTVAAVTLAGLGLTALSGAMVLAAWNHVMGPRSLMLINVLPSLSLLAASVVAPEPPNLPAPAAPEPEVTKKPPPPVPRRAEQTQAALKRPDVKPVCPGKLLCPKKKPELIK